MTNATKTTTTMTWAAMTSTTKGWQKRGECRTEPPHNPHLANRVGAVGGSVRHSPLFCHPFVVDVIAAHVIVVVVFVALVIPRSWINDPYILLPQIVKDVIRPGRTDVAELIRGRRLYGNAGVIDQPYRDGVRGRLACHVSGGSR